MHFSISDNSTNTSPRSTAEVDWGRRTQVFSISEQPLPPFRPPRIEEFSAKPPIRTMLASLFLHLAAVSVIVGLLPLLPLAFPFANEITIKQPEIRSDHVIYVPSAYLPQLQDSGGAESGKSGVSGGRSGYHSKQTIRVVRKSVIVKAVAEADLPVLPAAVPAANVVSLSVRSSAPMLPPHHPVAPAPPTTVQRPISNITAVSSGPLVVPPAPGRGARELSQKSLVLPVAEVVAPAPALGTRKLSDLAQAHHLDGEAVVPPPSPNVSADIHARNLETLTTQVTPPSVAPVVNAAASSDAETGPVTDSNSGSPKPHQLVVSGSPGEQVGVPLGGGSGSLALSPSGMSNSGLGGTGSGSGIGTGSGSGSGKSGSGTGAASSGTGMGASLTAKGGGSLSPGPGGSGTGLHPGNMPGVSIQGGNVYVPSFGSGGGLNASLPPDHGPHRSPTVTIVATARSGGALNIYGLFKGSKVYTVYIDTALGPVVLQYAEQRPGGGAEFNSDLSAPEPVDTRLPKKLSSGTVIITCTLGRDGGLHNIRVMKSASADAAHAIEAALQSWRFHPARNGPRAVDVDAVLGFGVDTR